MFFSVICVVTVAETRSSCGIKFPDNVELEIRWDGYSETEDGLGAAVCPREESDIGGEFAMVVIAAVVLCSVFK